MSEYVVYVKSKFREEANVTTAVGAAKVPGITVKNTTGIRFMLVDGEPDAIEKLKEGLGERFLVEPVRRYYTSERSPNGPGG